ncbi:hypothetical protein [Pseudomonas sp.]|uniref:hypothetical protein n=1 Tax=Pseudomonas sp. TaxID=306 RepID=UPI0039819D8B
MNRQDHPLVSLAILKARPGSGTENGLAGLDREPGNRNILSPGWAYEETSKATKLEVGELDIGKIQDVPGILKLYIKWGYEEFLKSKAAMDEVNQEQIRREVEKSGGKITGSDKSLRRSGR